MGFDEGRIILDSPNGAYYSGTTVSGRLVFQQEKEKSFRGIYVKFKGYCKVHWTSQESYTDSDGKSQTRTINHDSYEEYVNVRRYLVGGLSGSCKLDRGTYEYPFGFDIPQNCPSSFEGTYGHIRYHIKVIVDRAFKFDQEKKVAVRVFSVVDLNRDPYSREPIQMVFNEIYNCCCMGSGTTNTVVNVPVSGFCSGQVMPIEVHCDNKGTVVIDEIKMTLIKKIRFIASVNPAEKYEKCNVARISKGPIPTNTQRNYTVEMEIPALDVYNLNNCRYIEIYNKLKVVVCPSGCHSNSDNSQKIIIGNVPLVGYQDYVRNPLQDQMPQQVGIVTQQPLPSYSWNTPYRADEAPHPESIPYPMTDNPPPYPGYTTSETAPYTNPPYPTKNSSYSTESPSYTKSPHGTRPGVAALGTDNMEFTASRGDNVSDVPADPYAAASAPAPHSPVTDKKH
ncbi:unnamed protein product, partial [Brenthis ino]